MSEKTPFAAINLIVPFLMAMGAVGDDNWFGRRGAGVQNAGGGKREKANRLFSMLVYLTIFIGAVLTVLGLWLVWPASVLMGASGDLLEYCVSAWGWQGRRYRRSSGRRSERSFP
ncbi:MAG: hypothetical protein LUG50_01260 [Planctomycetaceae bacterium]|nr:hypothetical protein [Planctomycetaceae bacterium]